MVLRIVLLISFFAHPTNSQVKMLSLKCGICSGACRITLITSPYK